MSKMIVTSPIGKLLLCADDTGICAIRPLRDADAAEPDERSPVLEEAARQIEEYFAGKRSAFDLPLHPCGTAFERIVWQRLAEIPYGEICTYGQIAAQMGKPSASRAVGGACSRNPLLIVVPCHRVVAGTGRLTGFAAGMPAKRMLLAHEGWMIQNDRVQMK